MRKTIQLIALFFLHTSLLHGQNLVPNGSFETYTTCPFSTAQLDYTGNWFFCGASTDYYNACSPPGNMSVPSNIYGYQYASNGIGYIGMVLYAYGEGSPYNTREPAGTSLTSILTIGTKYYLSFKAVLVLNDFESDGACNKLGAKLSTIPYSSSNPAPVDNFAQVYTDSMIQDTSNWITIGGSFIADSAYSFITIGNFFDSSNSTYINLDSIFTTPVSAYYYIDDVRLSTDSVFVFSGIGGYGLAPDVGIFPNPSDGYIQITSNEKIFGIDVFSIDGKLLQFIQGDGYLNMLDLTHLASSIYIINIKTKSYDIRKKIIIR